jgi:hypothetical protein
MAVTKQRGLPHREAMEVIDNGVRPWDQAIVQVSTLGDSVLPRARALSSHTAGTSANQLLLRAPSGVNPTICQWVETRHAPFGSPANSASYWK